MNYDQFVLDQRDMNYKLHRRDVFLRMLYKKNISCNIAPINYETSYDLGILDDLYEVFKSITQSLRSSGGKQFENIIRNCFDYAGVEYNYQCKIKNHIVDFEIPYCNMVISTKTSLRERGLQDMYLNNQYKVLLVTLDNTSCVKKYDNVIVVDPKLKSLHCLIEYIKKIQMEHKTVNILDLFVGCGGFSTGFERACNEASLNVSITGVDIWDKAIQSYSANHPTHKALCADLEKLDVSELPFTRYDIIIGGPPCQAYSIAGSRDPNDPRNTLFKNFVKMVQHFAPRVFVMENVMGILSARLSNGEKAIDIIVSSFESIGGYHVSIWKLNASEYETPQARRRVFIVGCKDGVIEPPHPKSQTPVKTILDENPDPSLFLSDRAVEGINRRKQLMKSQGKGFGAQIINPDNPCYTISARYWKDGYDALVNEHGRLRKLSFGELTRVQSFPDTYTFIGSYKEKVIQIGNAVPVNLAYHVAKQVLHHIFPSTKYHNNTIKELKCECKRRGIKGYSAMKKNDLIELLNKHD